MLVTCVLLFSLCSTVSAVVDGTKPRLMRQVTMSSDSSQSAVHMLSASGGAPGKQADHSSVCLGNPEAKQQLHGDVLKSLCIGLGSANFLVFGTGFDSPFWMASNPKGHTRFLEHHAEWVKFQPEQVQKAETMVHYTSHFEDAMHHIHDTALLREFFDNQVPEDVKAMKWDQILVDSPEGLPGPNPGRGQSIFAALLLSKPGTVIFVDDCDRPVEMAYIEAHLIRDGRSLIKIDNGHGGTTCRISAVSMQVSDDTPRLPAILTREAYEQYVAHLKKAISNPAPEYIKKFPVGDGRFSSTLSMATGTFDGLKQQIEALVDSDLPGDIYETGTWRGGTSIFMMATLRAYERLKGKDGHRHYYGFDSFEGFKTDQTSNDETLTEHLKDDAYKAPIESVKSAFDRFGVLDDTVHFIKGYFEDTVPHFHVDAPIGLLRMDGDLYSSTKVVLTNLYPHLQKNSWVIIDDYDWHPATQCRQAVDEYRTSQGITSPLTSKYGATSWQKQ